MRNGSMRDPRKPPKPGDVLIFAAEKAACLSASRLDRALRDASRQLRARPGRSAPIIVRGDAMLRFPVLVRLYRGVPQFSELAPQCLHRHRHRIAFGPGS